MIHGFDLWVRKIPWRRKWQPTPVFLPGKSHGQRSLEVYVPWGHKRVGHDLVPRQQQHSNKLRLRSVELSSLITRGDPGTTATALQAGSCRLEDGQTGVRWEGAVSFIPLTADTALWTLLNFCQALHSQLTFLLALRTSYFLVESTQALRVDIAHPSRTALERQIGAVNPDLSIQHPVLSAKWYVF